MDYKLYKIHHSRGKSDTNFYQEQSILNGAYSSLKVLRVSIVNDLTHSFIKKKQKKMSSKSLLNRSRLSIDDNDNNDKGSKNILTLIERVLLFKQELDRYFFQNKIHLIKFHLNNICSIIMKNISDMQQEIINAYPLFKTSNIVRLLGNFSDVMSTFIETKPQEFYREIKDTILDTWEKNRIQIKGLFDKIEKSCNVNSNKEEFIFSIELYELFHNEDNEEYFDGKNNDENRKNTEEEDIEKLQQKLPAALKYLLKRKKDIMNFIDYMTQGILFTISRLFYNMDYYSIIISSLAFKIYYAVMHYVDVNKDIMVDLSREEKKEQLKVYNFLNHFIYLTFSFYKNIKSGKIALYNGGLNSLSKYVLNNFIEVISKSSALRIPKVIKKFKTPTLYQTKLRTKFYKCYPQRYKKYKDNSLLRIFMLYYNSKITFWKSILIIAKPKDDKVTITCRTCEKEIPVEEIFIHFGCCKEQQSFYDKMKLFKLKLEKYITNLDIYLAKSNINESQVNTKLFEKGTHLNIIMNKIPGFENNDSKKFIKYLIKLYNYEKDKSNDYYEKNPEKIDFIVSLSYFSLMIFLINKIYEETDLELSEIIGGIFCTFLQIFMNVNFILYVKKSKTKNNMIKFRKNRLNSYKYNNENDILGDSFTLPDSSTYESKTFEQSEKILNDDLLKSDLNIRTRIEKYKMKLSINNMLIFRRTFGNSHSESNYLTNSEPNFKRKNENKEKTVKYVNKSIKIRNTSNKKSKKIFINLEKNKSSTKNHYHSTGKYIKSRRKNSSIQEKNLPLIRRHSYNIYGHKRIRLRSKRYTRRYSCGNKAINDTEIYELLNKNNNLRKESLDNSNKNNNSCISENSQDSNNISIIDNDSNLFRYDSNISLFDSVNGTRDDSQKYITSSNSNSFQLEYIKDQKKNTQKLSLFVNEFKKEENQNEKKTTLFKKNETNNKEEQKDEKSVDDNSIDNVDNLYSSNGNNIFIDDFEEDELNSNNSLNQSHNSKDGINIIDNLEEDESNDKNKIIPNDLKQMFPDILNLNINANTNKKYHINYEQIAKIFEDLLKEMEENSNKENTQNNKYNDYERKISLLKEDRLYPYEKRPSKSVKFKDEKININTIKFNLEKEKVEQNIQSQNQKRITKFKLFLPIAKGGYGVVGLYKNVKTNDMYAIKTVDIKNMKEKNLSNTLKNEQNILKQIDSQFLVNSYFIFKDKKNYYFVMEYLPGGDVYTLLSKNNLPKKTIQLIVAETVLAVNYLHNIKIIHHDIKPENILITSKGHFKLSDFGLSKTIGGDDVDKNLKNLVEFDKILINFGDDEDETKDAVGTLNYMAPELFTQKYPEGGAIDYWAIGVLIFDLFSFSLPFEAPNQEELKNNIINMKIDWSKLINDEVKNIYGNINSAIDLIKKFLKENPLDRWGDKNLDEIKNHNFFEGLNWDDIEHIKNESIKEYVKKQTNDNNNKIKQRLLKEKNKEKNKEKGEKDEFKTEDGYPLEIEINLTESEEKYFFTERYDNLSKKNIEVIKKKIEKQANINIREYISDLMLIDLE